MATGRPTMGGPPPPLGPDRSEARRLLAEQATASGTGGVVASSSRTAAAIGTAALANGGNCADAALAAALAETVVLAPKCGLAGDLIALYRPPGASEIAALVAVGPAAKRLGALMKNGAELPLTGGLSVGVPGAPAGYDALAEKGVLGREAACAPAIALAEAGFSWTRVGERLAAEADGLLLQYQPGGCRLRPQSGPLREGDLVRLPGMAEALRSFGSLGAKLLGGPVGIAVLAKLASNGGVIDEEDLAEAHAEWVSPQRTTMGGFELSVTPTPTYGGALLVAMREWCSSPLRLDTLPAAVRAALREQSKSAGESRSGEEGTSVVAAVDAEGGAIVVVHSLSFPQFGSGLIVEDYDLVLSNRAGRGFSSDPENPNFPSPGTRPMTTLHAWSLRATNRAGREFLGATPGGDQQVGWNAQAIARLTQDPATDLGRIVTAPLWRHEGGGLVVESDHERLEDLEPFVSVPPLSMRSAEVIVSPGSSERMGTGAADPRLGAAVLAR